MAALNDDLANINDVADYIIVKATEAGVHLNLLKLQKLLYYSEAWRLAFTGQPLTGERFQAWVHGPVNRPTYDRFKDQKVLYSEVTPSDVAQSFRFENLTEEQRDHIDSVLEAYGQFSGTELEIMTHREEPWIKARGDRSPSERCDELISSNLMRDYYKARLPKA
jgi:uncharacterized phage-associated protein